jgi:hypothetical protein
MQCRQGRGSIPRVGIIIAGHEELWEVVVLVVEIFWSRCIGLRMECPQWD